jgi:hypothetical protein
MNHQGEVLQILPHISQRYTLVKFQQKSGAKEAVGEVGKEDDRDIMAQS